MMFEKVVQRTENRPRHYIPPQKKRKRITDQQPVTIIYVIEYY